MGGLSERPERPRPKKPVPTWPTYTRFRRRVARMTQLADWPLIRERTLALKTAGHTAQQIAEQLNREKRISPHHKPFTAPAIRAALSRCGLTDARRGASNDQLTLKTGSGSSPTWRAPSEFARRLSTLGSAKANSPHGK